eukprot:CAMPEP_0175799622 /NCGR_PEP_ID=MMETSP0097-20121207/86602_1 /TAXON_ID=311494 /ORGANISM="Alexandrium monilatum, Strain CCMP3105" /LENGTH=68 /DNA_ID=CAMNT_0017110897 /DNA_START=71 /DNA_END=274 /DNA_ORIENTATION=-
MASSTTPHKSMQMAIEAMWEAVSSSGAVVRLIAVAMLAASFFSILDVWFPLSAAFEEAAIILVLMASE